MQQKIKKYLVLGVLFILPITAYIFFSLSTNHFKPLPILTANVSELDGFVDLKGNPVELENHITILGFFGKNLNAHRAFAYNLAHKIYSKNHGFREFQFVIVLPEGTQDQAQTIESKLREIAPTDSWYFVFGPNDKIYRLFMSLDSNFALDPDLASSHVFIIDKERNLRGREDDDDNGKMYGYDSSNIAEINNKMSDDVKVLLAEYRRALKKYNSNREI